VGGRGFEVTGRGGMEGNLATNKGESQMEMVLGSVEGMEHNID